MDRHETERELRAEILRLAEEIKRLRGMLDLKIQASRKVVAERSRIRRELRAWLIGDILPEKDAGLVNGRRIVDEIDRICPGGG